MIDFREIAPGIRIARADCFEAMAELGPGSVDHVLTDPPYDKRTHAGATGLRTSGPVRLLDYAYWTDATFYRYVLATHGLARRWAVMTCSVRHHAFLVMVGHPIVRSGVWVKPNSAPQVSGDRPAQGHECVAILEAEEEPDHEDVAILHGKGQRMRWNGGGKRAAWTIPALNRGGYVAGEKPLGLFLAWVDQFTDPGDLVADFTMGAGTCAVACALRGRRFIGGDARTECVELAHARVLDALREQRRQAPEGGKA